jgi:D-sedoheptulose 7-phosphate isomerase
MRRCSPPRAKIAAAIIAALRSGNKLLIIGNGGSAADAQHIAAEIIGRYKQDRPAYAAIALTTDTSALTAIANDYGFEQVFARQVEGLGQRGDVLLALSTSGVRRTFWRRCAPRASADLSPSASPAPRAKAWARACDHLLVAPSDDTPVVQQIHLAVAHGICDEIEQTMMREARKNERRRFRPLAPKTRRLPRPRRRRQPRRRLYGHAGPDSLDAECGEGDPPPQRRRIFRVLLHQPVRRGARFLHRRRTQRAARLDARRTRRARRRHRRHQILPAPSRTDRSPAISKIIIGASRAPA